MDIIVVGHRRQAASAFRIEQQVVSHGAAERRNALALEIGERSISIAITRTDGQHLTKLVIRNAGGKRLPPSRDVFDPAQADVEIAAFRGLIERGELHLEKL